MTEAVIRDVIGRVTVLTINRPQSRNAIDAAVSEGMGNLLAAAATDEGVGAVVITGAGSQAFCSGMDLKSSAPATVPAVGPGIGTVLRDRYPKPLIAAVNGAAVGGGFDLVLACDLVVVAEHATFGLPEVKRGLASVGGSTRLAQRLPLAIALELTLTGDPIDAQRALALGLVNRVVDGSQVVDEAVRLARVIAGNAPLATAFVRALVHDTAGSLDAAAWAGRQASAKPIQHSDDARIGAQAFAERRVPVWTGR